MQSESRIFVAGHNGLVGGAIVRRLKDLGFEHLLLRSRAELDLTSQAGVDGFFAQERPDYVFLAAAKVGGIHANEAYPAEFLRENLVIQSNVIHSAWKHGASKLLFLGSSCIYPKYAAQPIVESSLLTGPLEPTNEWYAIAKIAGIKQCQAYRKQYGFDAISIMPTNLYGPGDNFDLLGSHVLPALIRKVHEAKRDGARTVVLWGTGMARREFLYVDDLADASVHLMQTYSDDGLVNVGTGDDLTILELAQMVCGVVGYEGAIEHDLSKPDGTPRKLLDVGKLHGMGWSAKISLRDGIERTYRWFLDNGQGLLPGSSG